MQKEDLTLLCWIITFTALIGIINTHNIKTIQTTQASSPAFTYWQSLPSNSDKVLSVKEYVRIEVEKAGLDWEEVYCLIQHESGWNDYAYNLNNSNKSSDFGLWQINSIHKSTISVKDRLNYKESTKWAIEKRLHDGNWDAWYGYLYNCK